jgi:hypothetical protein
MAGGSEEVGRSIQAITAGSAQNSASTEEVAASAEEMAAQIEEMSAQSHALAATAEQLQDLVARFVLDEDVATPSVAAWRRPEERTGSRPAPTVRRAG